MFNLIKAYQNKDPAAGNILEIILLYPGIKAIFFHRIAHFLHRLRLPFFPRLIAEFSRWLTGIEIHPKSIIGKNCVFDHGMGIVIGETAVIGNNVLIYQGVTLGSTQNINEKRHPTIDNGAILGAGSKLLGDIHIGKNAKIGANSVVLRDVPENCTAAGIPAKIISKASLDYQEWSLEYHI